MLNRDMIEWLDEPVDVLNENIEPGMVIEYEYGDFNHYVQTGILFIEKEEGKTYCWHKYGERVSDTDWTCMDESYGRSGGGATLVGYFDLDEYYAVNPQE